MLLAGNTVQQTNKIFIKETDDRIDSDSQTQDQITKLKEKYYSTTTTAEKKYPEVTALRTPRGDMGGS